MSRNPVRSKRPQATSPQPAAQGNPGDDAIIDQSAIPAASASLTTTTSRPVASANKSAARHPIQLASTLAALRVTPPLTIAGKVQPTGPTYSKCSTILATTAATASGTEGWGVSSLNLSSQDRAGGRVDQVALDSGAADVDAEHSGPVDARSLIA